MLSCLQTPKYAMSESNPSWLEMSPDTPFSLSNLPFGIFSTADDPKRRICTAIGDHVFDMCTFFLPSHLYDTRLQDESSSTPTIDAELRHIITTCETLNPLAALPRSVSRTLRSTVKAFFSKDVNDKAFHVLRDAPVTVQRQYLIPMLDAMMHLPFQVGDYTDFYAGLHHASTEIPIIIFANFF
jgi:fumarylacetoacetase